jgi:hypothetical protein
LATLCTLLLGFVIPLFALSGIWWATRPELMIGGLVFSLVLLVAYFYEELVHYNILRRWALIGGPLPLPLQSFLLSALELQHGI